MKACEDISLISLKISSKFPLESSYDISRASEISLVWDSQTLSKIYWNTLRFIELSKISWILWAFIEPSCGSRSTMNFLLCHSRGYRYTKESVYVWVFYDFYDYSSWCLVSSSKILETFLKLNGGYFLYVFPWTSFMFSGASLGLSWTSLFVRFTDSWT